MRISLLLLFVAVAVAQYSLIEQTLTIPRASPALASTSSKVFIAGGRTYMSGPTNRVEIWDIATRSFIASTTLSHSPRDTLIGLSFPDRVIFVDKETGIVEEYKEASGIFTTILTLTPPVTAAAINNKVVFFHGPSAANAIVYNIDTAFETPWLLCSNMCEDRSVGMGIGRVGNKLVFVGGGPDKSNRVTIYDDTTGSITSDASLLISSPRSFLRSVTVGDRIYFSGGLIDELQGPSQEPIASDSIVEVYDSTTNSFSSFSLQTPRTRFDFAVSGTKILFAGGYEAGASSWTDLVEVYDTISQTFVGSTHLSSPRGNVQALSVRGDAVFAGGSSTVHDFSAVKIIDIFEEDSLLTTLEGGFHTDAGILTVDNLGIIAGGQFRGGPTSGAFDIIEFSDGVSCSFHWECQNVGVQYGFARCTEKLCACAEGFTGSATPSDICKCPSPNFVSFETGNPHCLSLGQCEAQYHCHGVSENAKFVECVDNECSCLEGFEGSATPEDKCRCENVQWNGKVPSCLE